MAAVDPPKVLCVDPDREHAEQLAALLREHEIAVAVVPSDRHVGEWEVLVPARDPAVPPGWCRTGSNLD